MAVEITETPRHTLTVSEQNWQLKLSTSPAGGGGLAQSDINSLAKLNGIVADATLIDTNDARLSDARTPTAHNQTLDTITDAGTAAAADVGDFATAAQGIKADSALQSGGPLGTPSSGTLTNCTFPTLNQSTTGNAATATELETGRTINGVTFDGSQSITIGCAAVDVTGTISLAQGGTSSTTASGARTNLGLGAADDVTHASMTTTGFGVVVLNASGWRRTFLRTTEIGIPLNGVLRFYKTSNTVGTTVNDVFFDSDANNQLTLKSGAGGEGHFISGEIEATGTVRTGAYTVGTLPTPVTGMRCYVTDSNRSASTHFGSAVIAAAGGTSYTVPVFYDGTDWIIA